MLSGWGEDQEETPEIAGGLKGPAGFESALFRPRM